MMIMAVLFNFDGTLTEAGSIDFASIRKAIGCSSETPVLEDRLQLRKGDGHA
jgi:phosphoglycolate phosphatase-like HAD superfamily hydrolase